MKRSKVINGIAIHERNRFSCFVKESDTKGLEILKEWEAWFKKTGCPCALVETDRGFAVYRPGLQDDDDD